MKEQEVMGSLRESVFSSEGPLSRGVNQEQKGMCCVMNLKPRGCGQLSGRGAGHESNVPVRFPGAYSTAISKAHKRKACLKSTSKAG